METSKPEKQVKKVEEESFVPKQTVADNVDANEEIDAYSQYLNSGSD